MTKDQAQYVHPNTEITIQRNTTGRTVAEGNREKGTSGRTEFGLSYVIMEVQRFGVDASHFLG